MKILTALTLTLAATTTATADIAPMSVDFTAEEGFSDGPANRQNGLRAQPGVEISTGDGGQVTSSTKGYLRFLAFDQEGIDLNAIPEGESLTLVARGITVDRELPAATEQFMAFGLTFESKLNPDVEIGGQLLFDAEGKVWIDDQKWPVGGSPTDTGLNCDQPFDVVTVVTRTGPKAFTADTTVNGVTARTANVTDAASMEARVLVQTQGKTEGTWSVDAVDVNPATLPGAAGGGEPE